MTERAHRIEVDSCGECPFWHRLGCYHSTFTKNGSPLRFEPDETVTPPPKRCPLRGAVTMIVGPRAEFAHEIVADIRAQVVRNEVWGTCEQCPQHHDVTWPERCDNFVREDHQLPPKSADEMIKKLEKKR